MSAVRKDASGITPGARAVDRCAAEQRRSVVNLDRTVGFRRARAELTSFALTITSLVIDGAVGATVSTVTLSAVEATPVLPAASVAVAVKLWVVLAKVPVVKLQAPLPLAVALPSRVVPS